MRILFVGDIVGRPGRDILAAALRPLTRRHGIGFVIANVENSAGGFGVTRETGDAILKCGVHAMTSGNHIWDKKEVLPYIAGEPRLLRPLNYPAGAPGEGIGVYSAPNGERIAVINAMGRVHMPLVDNPFAALDRALTRVRDETPLVVVDFHAEVTSEKIALAWHLDGRATLVVGTHTHVQTADERVLPHGTAAITDVGMTGPHDGVIGIEKRRPSPASSTACPRASKRPPATRGCAPCWSMPTKPPGGRDQSCASPSRAPTWTRSTTDHGVALRSAVRGFAFAVDCASGSAQQVSPSPLLRLRLRRTGLAVAIGAFHLGDSAPPRRSRGARATRLRGVGAARRCEARARR